MRLRFIHVTDILSVVGINDTLMTIPPFVEHRTTITRTGGQKPKEPRQLVPAEGRDETRKAEGCREGRSGLQGYAPAPGTAVSEKAN